MKIFTEVKKEKVNNKYEYTILITGRKFLKWHTLKSIVSNRSIEKSLKEQAEFIYDFTRAYKHLPSSWSKPTL